MNGAYIIRRAKAIGVTFSIDADCEVFCEGPISRQLREVIEDNQDEIIAALKAGPKVVDFEAYRLLRDHNPGGTT